MKNFDISVFNINLQNRFATKLTKLFPLGFFYKLLLFCEQLFFIMEVFTPPLSCITHLYIYIYTQYLFQFLPIHQFQHKYQFQCIYRYISISALNYINFSTYINFRTYISFFKTFHTKTIHQNK